MSYTVNKLAKLSGVSPRTLRFYDEIGLLKPAAYGENKYRYYEEEQLLLLQQILFFRELDFPLGDIEGIMSSPDFDKVETLNAHKITLQARLEKTAALIKTIDKTLSHLRGETKMQPTNIYERFQDKLQKALVDFSTDYKKTLLDEGIMSQQDLETMTIAEGGIKNWVWSDFSEHFTKGDEIHRAFVNALENNLEPASPEVQILVEKHYHWSSLMSGLISKQGYYKSYVYTGTHNPQVSETYAKHHPKLMDYLFAAMKAYSESNV
jgi:DNA-binding transcriptional MerR regulator